MRHAIKIMVASLCLWALPLQARTDDAASLVAQIQAFARETSGAEVKGLLEQLSKARSNGAGSLADSTGNGAKGGKGVALLRQGKGRRDNKPNAGSHTGKCASTLLQQSRQGPSSHAPQLLVFISQSLPEDSVRELWRQVHKAGGKLVLRGLVGNSFPQTQAWVKRFAIVADIDPNKFGEFSVREVPTFILASGDRQDRMVGNVPLEWFLDQASRDGDLKEEASKLFQRLKGVP